MIHTDKQGKVSNVHVRAKEQEATKSFSSPTPPPQIIELPPEFNLLVSVNTVGSKGALWESSVLPQNTHTHTKKKTNNDPGQDLNAVESRAKIIGPPCHPT